MPHRLLRLLLGFAAFVWGISVMDIWLHVLPHLFPLPKERTSPCTFFDLRKRLHQSNRRFATGRWERFSFSWGAATAAMADEGGRQNHHAPFPERGSVSRSNYAIQRSPFVWTLSERRSCCGSQTRAPNPNGILASSPRLSRTSGATLGICPPNSFNRDAVVTLRLPDAATTPLALIYISPPHP